MEDRSWDISLASSGSKSGEDEAVEGCKQTNLNASDEARVFVAMWKYGGPRVALYGNT